MFQVAITQFYTSSQQTQLGAVRDIVMSETKVSHYDYTALRTLSISIKYFISIACELSGQSSKPGTKKNFKTSGNFLYY